MGGGSPSAAALLVLVLTSACAPTGSRGAREPPGQPATLPLVTGLDHVPIAVADLDSAAARYRKLGFVLKPGRPHPNGIRNQHVKFLEGTELELITAPEARDALTQEYRTFLASGDGPAFLALYAPAMDTLAARLRGTGRATRRSEGILSFAESDPLRYIFFGGRNASPTDRPEHFAHPNTARSLVAVWVAADDFGAERALFGELGIPLSEREFPFPVPLRGAAARVGKAEVRLLPGTVGRIQGRRIVGVTMFVESLEAAQRAVGLAPVPAESGRSILIPPEEANGLWIELWEPAAIGR